MNFVSKFLGTVRFENDQVAKIIGYGDYQLGNVIVSRVYYVEGLRHNVFSIGQFCDADLGVSFRKNTCFIQNLEVITSHQPKAEDTNQEKLYLLHMDLCSPISKDEAPDAIIKCIKIIQVRLNDIVRNVRTDNGIEFINQTLRNFYENVGILHQTSIDHTPQQNDVAERRNRTLVEVARTMLIFLKAPLFLLDEAINTACYTQNRSLIRLCYNKTPYELMHDKKPDLSFLHVFGSLCYPTNNNEDLGKLNANADLLTTIASEQFSLGPGLQVMTPATSSSGLVPNPIPQQPCNPPNRDDWDHLFQPMFDEYINPLTIVVSLVPVAAAPRAVHIADSPVSMTIDQDAP
ncbi:retrovirus-related pol polyprotein from transposon TNT 1-94 [Tanacetum coccineum]